jgi:hypothetical protein
MRDRRQNRGASRGFSASAVGKRVTTMKFETTRCNQCGSEMLMGVTVCPSCGKPQSGFGKPGGLYQPGAMLAVGLVAAVLLIFNWIKSPAPQPSQLTSPPSVIAPSR